MHRNDSKAFTECSSEMDIIYKDTDEYNPNTTREILIVFHDKIADMLDNRELNWIVKLFEVEN